MGVHWGEENIWRCPPPGFVVRVIRYAEACNGCGILIVPCWKSAPLWPLLCLEGVTFAPFVADMCELPYCRKDCFTRAGRVGPVWREIPEHTCIGLFHYFIIHP